MAIVHLTEASSGAPRLSGTNGDLCAVLDWALVQNGWAIEYTSGNARVYRPGSGNRFRLHVNHDSATSGNAGLAVVRGCENASGATTLTDPFPTVALLGNTLSNWLVSSAASTTARNFDIFVGTTFVIYAVNFSGATNVWEVHFFGDAPPTLAGDPYNTTLFVRNSTSTASQIFFTGSMSASPGGLLTVWWCRSFDGSVKSTRGAYLFSTTAWGEIDSTALPKVFLGPSGGLDSTKVPVADSGSTSGTGSATLGMPYRGWLPNFRMPIHSGRQAATPNARDTYTDTALSASFLGTIFCQNNAAASGVVVIEGDTWAPPSG